MPTYSEKDILVALDAAAEDGADFPPFDARDSFLVSRLQIYRDDAHWAIVFNAVAWNGDSLSTLIGPVGSGVESMSWDQYAAGRSGEFAADPEALMRQAQQMLADPTAMLGGFMASMRNSAKVVSRVADDYAQKTRDGVSESDKTIETCVFEYDESQADYPVIGVKLRGQLIDLASLKRPELPANSRDDQEFPLALAIASAYGEQLLATEPEIARFFPHGLPPHFMTLREWHHPDIAGGELPGSLPDFRLLAKAIAANDATMYRPQLPANTDWRNWDNV